MQQPLKISLAIDSVLTHAWIYRLAERILEEGSARINCVIRTVPEEEAAASKPALWRWHTKFDRQFFSPSPDAFAICDLSRLLPQAELLTTEAYLRRKERDELLIWLSDEQIDERLYSRVAEGIWAYVHGNPANPVDSDFLGYREFINLEGVIRSALVTRPAAGEGERLLQESWTKMPSMSLSRGRNEHFWKILSFVPRALSKKLRRATESTSTVPERPVAAGRNSAVLPSSLTAFGNLLIHGGRMLHKRWRKLWSREQWVLLVFAGQSPSLSFQEFKPLLPPKTCFWADPFLLHKDGRCYLFFEELVYETDKGHISVMELDEEGKATNVRKVLETPYHLSYPFLLKYEEELYMIPESYQADCIQVFKCTSFPEKWEPHMKLMDNVCAMDTTLLHFEGRWWLFAALTENPGASHHDELYLFYADQPLTTDWQPHPLNPIVSDARSARPAGNIYLDQGRLIRPSQDCSRKYGHGFYLNEIVKLSETEYQERPVRHILPDWDRRISRTHSYVFDRGFTVIDGVIQRKKYGLFREASRPL